MRNLPPNGVAGLQRCSVRRLEALAAAAGHDDRQGAAGQSADVASSVGAGRVSHGFPGVTVSRSDQSSIPWPACHTRQFAASGISAIDFSPLLDSGHGPAEAVYLEFGNHAIREDRRPGGCGRGPGPGTRAARPRSARLHAAVRLGRARSPGAAAGAAGCRSVGRQHRQPGYTRSRCAPPAFPVRAARSISSIARSCSTGRRYTRAIRTSTGAFCCSRAPPLESCLRLGFAPDVFHCNDWHCGFPAAVS